MTIPGTNSTAVQNQDGTWDILDVPVIHDGSIPRYDGKGQKVDVFTTDASWFRHVISVHARAEGEGRMGRAFLDHHDEVDSGSQPDAGYIRPQRVGELVVKGKALPALFVDIVSVPDVVYQEYVKTGRLAGRSIESLAAPTGWINGLALMPTRPAHYSLPILTIGREVVSGETSEPRREPLAAVACASGDRALAIFAKETPMPDEKDKKDEDKDESPVAKGEGEGDKDSGGEGGGGSGWKAALDALKAVDLTAEEIPEVVAAITEFATSLEAPAGGDEMVEDEETPTIEDVPLAEQEVEEPIMGGKKSKAVIMAEAKADVALAKAQGVVDEMALRDAVDAASVELREYHPMIHDKATLRAKADEVGLVGLKVHVDAIKAYGTKNPGPGGATPPADHVADVPDEVMAITDPADREIAMKTNARLTALAGSGWDMDGISLKGAIQRDIKAARLQAKA